MISSGISTNLDLADVIANADNINLKGIIQEIWGGVLDLVNQDYTIAGVKFLTTISKINASSKSVYLPKAIGTLQNIEALSFGFCNIMELCDEISQLQHLRRIFFMGCKFDGFPTQITSCKNLEDLALFGNSGINTIPAEIQNLTNLQNLDLSSVREIPDYIGNLKNLTRLNITSSKLTEIPDFVRNFPKLSNLDVSGNYITDLPDYLKEMTTLRVLDLGINHLDRIPKILYEMPFLKSISIFQNYGIVQNSAYREFVKYCQDAKISLRPVR